MTISVAIVTDCDLKDISIAPSNVAAVRIVYFFCVDSLYVDGVVSPQNTYSTAATIGEKAATIIAEELGIKNV